MTLLTDCRKCESKMNENKDKENKKSNFFNLDSDETDEDEEKKKKEELEKGIQKWDWDRAENFDLYFKFNKTTENKSAKRSLLLVDYDDNEEEKTDNKIKNNKKLYNQSMQNKPFIKLCENDSIYDLIGHKSSVNRIHWSKKTGSKNFLLSSSMDRFVFLEKKIDFISDKFMPQTYI